MSRAIASALLAAIAVAAHVIADMPAPRADELSVRVENLSKPVLCAEEDNVTLTFVAPAVRRFRIEAVHPAYLAGLRDDNWNADWTACDFGPDATKTASKSASTTTDPGAATGAATGPVTGTVTGTRPGSASAPPTSRAAPAKPATPSRPERITLYEDVERWLVGLRFPNFWRPATTRVRVGDTVTEGLHLLQLWRVRPNGGEEVLVLYPQDGYWRARPLGPKGRDLTAFGSSFLIGPVEQDGRPLVALKEVAYRPDLEGFDLTFSRGGRAQIKLAEASATRLALDVTLEAPINGQPFAALRSMYITAYNNDVAAVAVRSARDKAWSEAGIMDFKGATTAELWAGRRSMSRHNTSAPDMIFKWFR